MATARVPIDQTVAAVLHLIPIATDGTPQYPGLIIADADQVEFQNNASVAMEINFVCANGPVFNDIASIAAGGKKSTAQSPLLTEITTDYYIKNLSTGRSNGPYSIEVGINTNIVPAPLLIPVTNGSPRSDLQSAAVPQGGWLQFDLDDSYDLSWSNSAFPAPSNPIGPGLSPAYQAQPGNNNVSTDYSLVSDKATTSGSVHIHS